MSQQRDAGLAAQRDPAWLFESLGGDAGGRGAARVNVPETLIFRLCVTAPQLRTPATTRARRRRQRPLRALRRGKISLECIVRAPPPTLQLRSCTHAPHAPV